MPPKAKFTREEVISAALGIVEQEGEKALTARSLGGALNSSARPIFTLFSSMDEVLTQVITAAKSVYKSYVDEGLTESPAFKGVGKSYIRFASERPQLFALLFMRDMHGTPDVNYILNLVDDSAKEILRSIVDGYGFDEATAKKLYVNMWLYTHGIATLIVTGVCSFSADEISNMMTDVCTSLIVKYKTQGGK
ncbi:MAG: TetR/AcrR family transcriptional regulator [Clostridiales bacterium]|nr:TetR/AcrR family transcriptional regulator [Clostridiales bacterium]